MQTWFQHSVWCFTGWYVSLYVILKISKFSWIELSTSRKSSIRLNPIERYTSWDLLQRSLRCTRNSPTFSASHGEPFKNLNNLKFSCFVDKHGDLIYKEMYGAKIILEDRKSFAYLYNLWSRNSLVKSIRNHTVTVFFEADFSCHLALMFLLFTCDKLIKSQSFTWAGSVCDDVVSDAFSMTSWNSISWPSYTAIFS